MFIPDLKHHRDDANIAGLPIHGALIKAGTLVSLFAVFAWAVPALSLAQNRQSAQKEADDLRQQVEMATQRGDVSAVLKAMDRYHHLYRVVVELPRFRGQVSVLVL